MRTHPTVIFGDRVMKNDMYFVPPEQYLSPHSDAAELERMLTGMLEHDRVQSALQDAEARFRTAVDLFPSQYVIFDPEFHITFMNRRALNDLGLAFEAIRGLSAAEVFPPDVADKLLRGLRDARDSRAAVRVTWESEDPSAGRVETYLIPVTDEDDNSLGMLLGVSYEHGGGKSPLE